MCIQERGALRVQRASGFSDHEVPDSAVQCNDGQLLRLQQQKQRPVHMEPSLYIGVFSDIALPRLLFIKACQDNLQKCATPYWLQMT